MSRGRSIRNLFRFLVRRERLESELDEEFRSYLDMAVDDHIRQGVAEPEARRRARAAFGGVSQVKEADRAARIGSGIDGLWRDIREAVRGLVRAPAFTAFVIVSIGLGVGASTAIYSFIHALVLEPPAIRDIDRVVNIYHTRPPGSVPILGLSWPDYEDLEDQQTSFAQVAFYALFIEAVADTGWSELVHGEMVGGDYFALVGARPVMGRLLSPEDGLPGASAVAVIGEAFWTRAFGADPSIVGQTVSIANRPFEIVGVVDSNFGGTWYPNGRPTPVWIPFARAREAIADVDARFENRESRSLLALGRLADGVPFEQAQQEVRAIGARLDAEYPIGQDRRNGLQLPFYSSRLWHLVPTARAQIEADIFVAWIVYAALGTVLAVLLVSCTNVANLSLARVAQHRNTIAVRHVLGASHERLIRAELVAGIILALAGGLAGLGVAHALSVMLSAPIGFGNVVLEVDTRLHLAALFMTTGAAVVTVVAFSLVPALRVIGSAVHGTGSWSSSQRVASRWRVRRGLIGIQVAVSTMLVALVLLSVQQIRASRQDIGIDLDRIAGVEVGLAEGGFDEAGGRLMIEDALLNARNRIRSEDLALASVVPFGPGRGSISVMSPDDMEGRVGAQPVVGTPGLFRVMGLDFVRGAPFDDREAAVAEAVVTEDLAERLFGTVEVLGVEILTRRQQTATVPEPPVKSFRIVGVVERIRGDVVGRQQPYLFLPWPREYDERIILLARASGGPESVVGDLVQAVLESDSETVVVAQGTGRALAEQGHAIQKAIAGIGGLISASALILALGGLYGVLSYAVSMRRRELGIRLALGADPSRIRRAVIGEGIRPVAAGVAVGLALAVLAWWRVGPIFSALFPTANVLALAVLPVPLLLAGAAACYLPARRASGTDPTLALREDG